MEVQEIAQVKIFLLLGVTLFAGVGFCKPISVSPCLGIYISESYFEKHDSLLDSSFDSYIANELPVALCGTLRVNLETKLSVHKRRLIGEGSHRRMLSTVQIDTQRDPVAEYFSQFCKLILVERLPGGIFADPFELQHLLDRGVFTDATVFGDTNLELPSVSSNRSIVEVHIDIGHNILSGHNNGLKIDFELPLHARYPPLGDRGFSRVEFGWPDLFVLCNTEENLQNGSCLLAQRLDAESQTVVWDIPCGIKEHSKMVSVVTFISAVVSAFSIVLTSMYYPPIHKS